MNILVRKPIVRSNSQPPLVLTAEEVRVLAFLVPLSSDYPTIENWFVGKVVPGVRQGSRFLLPVERLGELVGVGIAKKEAQENKICTVRVAPNYVGRGVGLRLFDGLLKWLDDDHPHLTVSKTKLPLFERIFDYYGFEKTSTDCGRYLPKMVELCYNEFTPSPSLTPVKSTTKIRF